MIAAALLAAVAAGVMWPLAVWRCGRVKTWVGPDGTMAFPMLTRHVDLGSARLPTVLLVAAVGVLFAGAALDAVVRQRSSATGV